MGSIAGKAARLVVPKGQGGRQGRGEKSCMRGSAEHAGLPVVHEKAARLGHLCHSQLIMTPRTLLHFWAVQRALPLSIAVYP